MKTVEEPPVEKGCIDRVRKALKPLMQSRTFMVGDRLFEQGSTPAAVFFLRTGRVQFENRGVEHPAHCVAKAGDVIGVTFAISGRPYDMDAVVTKAARLEVVDRDDFLRVMTESTGLHLDVVRMLSVDLGRCYAVLRTLGPKTRTRNVEEALL